MARVNLNNHADNTDFSRVIKASQLLYGKNQKNLAQRWNQSVRTVNDKINNPENMKVDELRRYIKELHISQDKVLRFLGWSEEEIDKFCRQRVG